MKKTINDKDIKRGLNSLDFDIPLDVEKRVNSLIVKRMQEKKHFWGFLKAKNPILKWAPAYLVLFLFVILGVSNLKKDPDQSNFPKEIIIKYELKEKNIKIVWVKKQKFSLRRLEK